MTSTQVSFSAFALAQQAVSCTPPAANPDAAPVVAHWLGVGSGGECTPLRARRSLLVVESRHLLDARYVVADNFGYGPEVFPFWGRARAWNYAQRYGGTFFDLGASA